MNDFFFSLNFIFIHTIRDGSCLCVHYGSCLRFSDRLPCIFELLLWKRCATSSAYNSSRSRWPSCKFTVAVSFLARAPATNTRLTFILLSLRALSVAGSLLCFPLSCIYCEMIGLFPRCIVSRVLPADDTSLLECTCILRCWRRCATILGSLPKRTLRRRGVRNARFCSRAIMIMTRRVRAVHLLLYARLLRCSLLCIRRIMRISRDASSAHKAVQRSTKECKGQLDSHLPPPFMQRCAKRCKQFPGGQQSGKLHNITMRFFF